MKKLILRFLPLMIAYALGTHPGDAQVAVSDDNSFPDPSAMLEVKSSTKGFLPPRMSTAERDAIPDPQEGLVIYNTDFKGLNAFNGTTWGTLSGAFTCGLSQVEDADGNLYNTLRFGRWCWMASNVNTGVRVNLNESQTDNGIIEKYCYNDSVANCHVYGGLYQWGEVVQYLKTEGARGVCPDGWHVATFREFDTLINMFQGHDTAGAALKEAGYAHWLYWPGTSSTNASGFTALPGGKVENLSGAPQYYGRRALAYFWTSSFIWDGPGYPQYAVQMVLRSAHATATLAGAELTYPEASSVRCVRIDP